MTGDEQTSPSTEQPTGRRRLARVLGWVAKGLVLVLFVVVVLVAGGVAYLRTESGLAQLARLVEWLASSEQSSLTIGRLEGAFPEHLRLENVSLHDQQGTLVSLDYAELRWRPWRLLSRHLAVTSFEIGTLALDRLPATEPAPAQETGLPSLPSLPVDVTLDAFRLRELRLGEAIIGQPASITATASLSATREGEFAADADVHTLDGAATRVSLTAGYDKSTQHLKIDVKADEPGGGMVASLLGLKGAPPLHLQAKGDGPLRDWQGRLEAAAGDVAGINANVRLSGEKPRRVALDGGADVQGLLPPDLAPLAAGGVVLRAEVDAFSDRIALNDLAVSTAAGSLRGAGALLPGEKRIDGKLALTLGPASVWQPLAPGIGYDAASADILLSGTLPVPECPAQRARGEPDERIRHAPVRQHCGPT